MSGPPASHPVLVVDDDLDTLQGLGLLLQASGIAEVETCAEPRRVEALLAERSFECVLLDLSMPHLSGEELLVRIRESWPTVPVIVVTGNDLIDTAVRCMRQGAADYIVKPVEENRLVASVRRLLDLREMDRVNASLARAVLEDELCHPEAFAGLVTASAAMRRVFRYVEAVAPTRRPLLIGGETGTGKELLARAAHQASGVRGDFVPVNVAGLDDHFFTDTLFGHRRGAFTGAESARKGLVDTAAGGTLLLDEIGDLPVQSQVKLLRLLQEGDYLPLGSDLARRADCRVICATHVDLEQRLAAGSFRRDLYYRLTAHRVIIPPLRERPEDLPLLVEHFVARAAGELGRPDPVVPPGLYDLIGSHPFPGNVRELESLIYDAVSRQRGSTLSLDVFRGLFKAVGGGTAGDGTGGVQRESEEVADILLRFGPRLPDIKTATDLLVAEALHRANGNQSAAAAMLGISRQALNKRIRKG